MGTRYEGKLGRYRSRSHKSEANAHPQNSIPGKDTRLKTTQVFFINTCELYVTSWSLSKEVKFSVVKKFSKFLVCPITNGRTRPVNPIYLNVYYIKEAEISRHDCALIKIAMHLNGMICY